MSTDPALEAERAAFEAELTGRWTTELTRDSNGDEVYLDEDTAHAFIGWCMARRTAAPVAEGVALPPLDAEGLPSLPDPTWHRGGSYGVFVKSGYTAEQVRQAQRDAVEADRRARGDKVPEWIILQRVGCVPELKGPLSSPKQTEDMLRELYDLYPGCICTIAAMPRTSYPQSGREWIDMHGDKRRKPLPAYIGGRADGTAPASLVECTQAMLEAAMKAAVAAKMFPPSGSEHAYLRYWYGMKASVDAALAAAPSPLPPQEEAK